jgi:GH24 family phage-related lysozyme (muramidase)
MLGKITLVILIIMLFFVKKININLVIDKEVIQLKEEVTLRDLSTSAVRVSNVSPSLEKEEEVISSEMTDYEITFLLLKSCESFRPTAYWDVNQWTNGWGTKSKEGEVISLKEANKRASKEFNRVYSSLDKRFPKLERWTKLVLTVTDYNVGHFGEQLNSAINSGNKVEIARVMKLYFRDANGKKLDGLVKRRNKEAALLLASRRDKQKIGIKIKKKVLDQIKKNRLG